MTDMIYSDTPTVNKGVISAQIFVSTDSLMSDMYRIKSDSEFVNTL